MKYRYLVYLPLPGSDAQFLLCECSTVEAALCVIEALLSNSLSPPASVTVRLTPAES